MPPEISQITKNGKFTPSTVPNKISKKRTVSKKELILLNTSPKINPLKP